MEGDAQIARHKHELRQRYLRLRADLGGHARAEADALIAAHVLASDEYHACDVLLTYLSIGDEVDTRRIVERAWEDGKAVALPRCIPNSRRMGWYVVDDLDHLVKSRFGVEEPVPDPARELDPSRREGDGMLALVPGLAFDARGFRLGYGGGFYDVFLSGFAGRSLGLCREAQLVEDLVGLGAVDAFDLPVDRVVSERGER